MSKYDFYLWNRRRNVFYGTFYLYNKIISATSYKVFYLRNPLIYGVYIHLCIFLITSSLVPTEKCIFPGYKHKTSGTTRRCVSNLATELRATEAVLNLNIIIT